MFSGVLEVKLKFQDKFYNIIDYNKYPSSEKEDEKGIFRKSYFHQIQPSNNPCPIIFYIALIWLYYRDLETSSVQSSVTPRSIDVGVENKNEPDSIELNRTRSIRIDSQSPDLAYESGGYTCLLYTSPSPRD